MTRRPLLLASVVLIPLIAGIVVAGCSSSGSNAAFHTLSERASYGPNSLIAFAAFGGNGLRYVSSINERGGSVTSLTPSDSDDDLTDEGGFHPAYSPDGATIAMASRRGASEDIFLINSNNGDRNRLDQMTTDAASDGQPTWSPDGTQLVFTTNRDGDNNLYILTVASPTTTQTAVTVDAADDQWASFAPDGNQVAFQSDR